MRYLHFAPNSLNCNNLYPWSRLGETCKKVDHKPITYFHCMKRVCFLLVMERKIMSENWPA
jgi:hypothetical protein